MENNNPHEITARFVEVINKLKDEDYFKSFRELARELDVYEDKISKIIKRYVLVELSLVADLCKAYPVVNLNYIMFGIGTPFIEHKDLLEEYLEEQGFNDETKKIVLENVKTYLSEMKTYKQKMPSFRKPKHEHAFAS